MPTLSEVAADIYRTVFAAEPNPTQTQAIATWIRQERGTPLDSGIFTNNPLNITLTPQEARGDFADSWVPKGAGGADSSVRAFPTLERGIAANAKRLWDGSYANIRAALMALGNGGSLDNFWNALRASPWAASRYAGINFTSSYSSLDPNIPWGAASSQTAGMPGGVKLDPKPSMSAPSWAPGAPAVATVPKTTTVTSPLKDWWDGVTSPWTFFQKLIREGANWRKLGLALLGSVLIIVGIMLYARGWLPTTAVTLGIPGTGVGATIGGKGK